MSIGSMYLLVGLGEEFYALPSSCIREVVRWRAPTPIPGASNLLLGIINQRGVIVPIVDMRLLFGLPAQPPDRATRLVILRHAEIDLALLVDVVFDLIDAPEAVSPIPPTVAPHIARLMRGVARITDRPLALLDVDALIGAIREGQT